MDTADLPSKKPSGDLSDWWHLLSEDPNTLESAITLVQRLLNRVNAFDQESYANVVADFASNEAENLHRWLYRIGHWVQSKSSSSQHWVANWLTVSVVHQCRLTRRASEKIIHLKLVKFTARSRIKNALKRLQCYRAFLPATQPTSGFELVPRMITSALPGPRFAPFYFSTDEMAAEIAGTQDGKDSERSAGRLQSDAALRDMHNYQSWCRALDIRMFCQAYNRSFASLNSTWRIDLTQYERKVDRIASKAESLAYRGVRTVTDRCWETLVERLRAAIVKVLKDSGELPRTWAYPPWKPIGELSDLREWIIDQRAKEFYSDLQWADPLMREPDLIATASRLALQVNDVLQEWGHQPLDVVFNTRNVTEAEQLMSQIIDRLSDLSATPSDLKIATSDVTAERKSSLQVGEFVFAVSQRGSIDLAEIRAFGEKAILSDLKGIRQLHTIVFAGPTGALMSQLSGRGKVRDTATGDIAKDEEVIDPTGRERMKAEIEDLEKKRDVAVRLCDDDRAASLDAEIDEIARHLRRGTTLGGKPRLFNNVGTWRATIHKNLETVYNKLRMQDARRIAEHFEASINSDGSAESTAVYIYAPVERIEWKTHMPS